MKYTSLVIASALGATIVFPAYADNQIVIDWATQKLISYPTIVNARTNAVVMVNNVNDLLYQYRVDVVASPRATDDAANLLTATVGGAGAMEKMAVGATCSAEISSLTADTKQAAGQLKAIFDCTTKKAGGKSKSLQDTVGEWSTFIKGASLANLTADRTGVQQCGTDQLAKAALSLADSLQADIDKRQKAIDGPHQVQQATVLDADNDYKVTVTELCNGAPTGTPLTVTFSPSSNILTLSLGALLSTIEQRSYTSLKDPANTQQNLLAVNGAGRLSPLGVGLLNYDIPGVQYKYGGLSVSSGLVIKFGSTNVTASSLGWFGGAGFHLYHRFFVACGAHFGQFSDFPAGLVKGSVVPANFGALTGVNRATTRLAFSVTYQTKSLVSSQSKPKTVAPSGGSTPSN